MLPRDHVLDLIKTSTTKSNAMSAKRQFVDQHRGKWALIRQEHLHNGQSVLNHIEGVHEFHELPHENMTKNHTVYPVTDEMATHGSFRGHEKFI